MHRGPGRRPQKKPESYRSRTIRLRAKRQEAEGATYSTIVSLRIKPEGMDQALGIYRRGILPQIDKRRGYASSLVFSCKEKNELISCALLETHDSMVEVDWSGFLQRFASGSVWLRTLATPMAPI